MAVLYITRTATRLCLNWNCALRRLSTLGANTKYSLDLRPVLTLKSKAALVRTIDQ